MTLEEALRKFKVVRRQEWCGGFLYLIKENTVAVKRDDPRAKELLRVDDLKADDWIGTTARAARGKVGVVGDTDRSNPSEA